MYIYTALTGIKNGDAERAENVLDDSGVCFDAFAEYVKSHLENIGGTLEDIDIVSMAYQFIAMAAEVSKLTEYLFANYCDTQFDISSDEASSILNKVPEDQRNDAWRWVFTETNSYFLDQNNTEEK